MSGFVETKCSLAKKTGDESFENVKFVSYKAKQKTDKISKSQEEQTFESKKKSVNMRKLRFDVIKLGTSGMDPTKKEASSIAMLMALGAKPPKRKYVNYTEILRAKCEEKEKSVDLAKSLAKEPVPLQNRHLYVVGSKVIPAKPKEAKDNIKNFLGAYGKPGKPKIGKGSKKKRRA